MQWHTQAGNITANLKVEVDFTLPEIIATNVMTWKYYVGDSNKGRYDIILGRDLLTELELNLKWSDHINKVDYGPLKGFTASMVDLCAYEFKYMNTVKLYLKNHWKMLIQKKYISQNMSALLLNNNM